MRYYLAIFCLISTLFVGPLPAHGQQATDTEILAGYCLGVIGVKQRLLANLCTHPSPLDATTCTAFKPVTDQVDRIRQYLLAKGFFGSRDFTPIALGQRRGETDIQRLTAPEIESKCHYCNDSYQKGAIDAWSKCVDACADSAEGTGAQARVKRCENVDALLPF